LSISDKNDRLTIIIPKELKEQVKDLADKEKRSMGNYIVQILEEHVKQKQAKAAEVVLEEQMSYDSELTNEQMEAAIKAMYNLVKSSKGNKNTSNDK
jgi:predicted transcriptional regulator